jgi:hypothetical protein
MVPDFIRRDAVAFAQADDRFSLLNDMPGHFFRSFNLYS